MFLSHIVKCLYKPKLLLLIIDLPLFAKLFELLATNRSLSEKRDILVPRLLNLSHVLVVLQLTWVRTSPLIE